MSLPPRLALAASRCACSGAARTGSKGLDHPLPGGPGQRIADTLRAATEPSAPSEGIVASNLGLRLQTPCRNEATPARRCDDQGKNDDRRDERHIASRSGVGPVGAAVMERGGAAPNR